MYFYSQKTNILPAIFLPEEGNGIHSFLRFPSRGHNYRYKRFWNAVSDLSFFWKFHQRKNKMFIPSLKGKCSQISLVERKGSIFLLPLRSATVASFSSERRRVERFELFGPQWVYRYFILALRFYTIKMLSHDRAFAFPLIQRKLFVISILRGLRS